MQMISLCEKKYQSKTNCCKLLGLWLLTQVVPLLLLSMNMSGNKDLGLEICIRSKHLSFHAGIMWLCGLHVGLKIKRLGFGSPLLQWSCIEVSLGEVLFDAIYDCPAVMGI